MAIIEFMKDLDIENLDLNGLKKYYIPKYFYED